MLDTVPEQVLEEVADAPSVRLKPQIVGNGHARAVGLHCVPALCDDRVERDEFRVPDLLSLSGHRENVGDQVLHPVQRSRGDPQVVAVAGRSFEIDAALCDVQRASEVVGDDAGELIEPVDLCLRPFRLELRFQQPRDKLSEQRLLVGERLWTRLRGDENTAFRRPRRRW